MLRWTWKRPGWMRRRAPSSKSAPCVSRGPESARPLCDARQPPAAHSHPHQQITGIRDADVNDAPLFSAVAPELRAFVGSDVAAVVAHNVAFDLAFLRAHGVEFHRPTLDTFELATILLPGGPTPLGELCHRLEIPRWKRTAHSTTPKPRRGCSWRWWSGSTRCRPP